MCDGCILCGNDYCIQFGKRFISTCVLNFYLCAMTLFCQKKNWINSTKYWQMPRKLKKNVMDFPPWIAIMIFSQFTFFVWISSNVIFSRFFLLAFHVWREYYFAFGLSHDLEFGVWSENEFFKHLICLANYMIWRMSVYILYIYSL